MFFTFSSNAPGKKKCLKQTPPGCSEMSNKNVDGSNMNSPESGNENEARFFNNLKWVFTA